MTLEQVYPQFLLLFMLFIYWSKEATRPSTWPWF